MAAYTTTGSISVEFPAAYYKTQVMKELAKKYLFYQFAMKQPLPKNNGKTVQFRKAAMYTPEEDPTALVEGTPPAGLTPSVSEVLVPIKQFGDFTPISDLASFTAVDNLVALEVDKITRLQHEKIEKLNVKALKLASNVVFAAASNTPASSQSAITASHVLTSLELRKAVRDLKKNNATPFYRNGKPYFICIVNPDSVFALQNDTTWQDVSKYQQSEKIENGEIGKLFGCIVVESPFPIQWYGANLTAANRSLTVKTTLSAAGKTFVVDETISAAEATALAGRPILVNGTLHTIDSVNAGTGAITTLANVAVADATAGNKVYPGEGGAAGAAVQGAVVFGENAYGNVELEGERNIEVYANESGGPGDPLHQLRTVGVKINGFGAAIVDQNELVMIKHGVSA